MGRVRVGTLVAGETFRTLLTERSGRVLLRGAIPIQKFGIPVRFFDGELKLLHPEIEVNVVKLPEVH
jgi:hypothetical protein